MPSDNFNRADESPIGSPWTNGIGTIVSGEYVGGGSAIWRGDSTNQRSQLRYVTVGPSTGPAINVTAGGDLYYARDNGSGLFVRMGNGGVFSSLNAAAGSPAVAGDTVAIYRVGNDIIIAKNGVFVSSVTDTTHLGGFDGLNAGVGIILDDWTSDLQRANSLQATIVRRVGI